MSRFRAEFEPLWCAVAQEQHQDGDPHIHLVAGFTARKQCHVMAKLDSIAGSHGNYQTARNPAKVLQYVRKDGRVIEEGAVPGDETPKKKMTDLVMADLQGGMSFRESANKYPGFTLMNSAKIRMMESQIRMWSIQATRKDWKDTMCSNYPAIATWLNENVRKPRLLRQKQLWVQGLPGVGKSRMSAYLQERLNCYLMPSGEDFHDFYDDEMDLIIADEFVGKMQFQECLKWLDGQVMPVRKKGAQYLKMKALPMLVLSNRAPESCYSGVFVNQPSLLEALLGRLEVIVVSESFHLEEQILCVNESNSGINLEISG